MAKVDTKTFDITYTKIKEPIEDFFIDPFEDYLIGTARRGKVLSVYDLKKTLKMYLNIKWKGCHIYSLQHIGIIMEISILELHILKKTICNCLENV